MVDLADCVVDLAMADLARLFHIVVYGIVVLWLLKFVNVCYCGHCIATA